MNTWRNNSDFNAAMDGVYRSFMLQKSRVEGRHDREVRDPNIILNIARKLDLIPLPENVIRVTGSKGKGTTSRMIARLLQAQGINKVGLFVSPEELDHNDRMRINDQSPSRDEFAKIFQSLEPELTKAQETLRDGRYISPFGIFLIIALKYFKDNGVDVFVLEGGRGAEFDEVGNIPSRVAVVTSILLEHASSIGPTIDDVARNKLFIGTNADVLVTSAAVQEYNSRLKVVADDRIKLVAPPDGGDLSVPTWVLSDIVLAEESVRAFMKTETLNSVGLTDCSASFGVVKFGGGLVYFDGSVNLDSIDQDFFRSLLDRFKKVNVLASLPDDKDVNRVRDFFLGYNQVEYKEIALSGTRGYLHYDEAKAAGTIFAEIPYEDIGGLTNIVEDFVGSDSAVYCVGTQTYIRLVKMALREHKHGLAGAGPNKR